MKALQTLGLLLWRSGLMLAGGWTTYEGLRRVLRYFALPRLAEAGIAMILTGATFVVASLILERIADAREEGDLTQ